MPTDRIFVGDVLRTLRRLPSRCVDLVILDPPYWKVVNEEWDHQWRTEADYRAWCACWIAELGRVCKRSASVWLFGYVRNLIRVFSDFEAAGFEFRQEVTIDKGMRSVAGRKTSAYKQFPNTTETVFFFVYDAKPHIRQLLQERQKATGLTTKEINRRLGVKSGGGGMWSLYAGDNIMAQIPTQEMWGRLESALGFDAPDDLKGFTFNSQMGLSNVWTDIDFYSEKRIHRTQKPFKLIERIVISSSLPGHVVLDPFAGSGVTAVVARATGRKFVSFDADSAMVEKANGRLSKADVQGELF